MLSTNKKLSVRHIVLLLLFFAAMELANKTFYLVVTALIIFLLLGRKNIQISIQMLPLAMLAISLFLFSPDSRTGITGAIKPFCYLICAVLGYNLMEDGDTNAQEKQLIKIIVLMTAGQFVHFLLNFVYNYELIGQRNTLDVWSREVRSATGQAMLAAMMVGLAVPVLFCNVSRWKKLLAVASLVIVVIYNLKLAGRSLFVLIAIAAAVCLLFKLFTEKNANKRLRILLAFGTVLCFTVVLVVNNVFGLQDKLRETNFFNRFFGKSAYHDINEDGRMAAKIVFLKNFLEYPWGGFHIRKIAGTYAHDILLDTHDEAGVFAFIAMLWFVIVMVAHSWKVFKNQTVSTNTRTILVCFMFTMWVEFMIEPILAGMQAQLMAVCVIYGALCKFFNNISTLPEGAIRNANCTD